jgi:hypothetical protein
MYSHKNASNTVYLEGRLNPWYHNGKITSRKRQGNSIRIVLLNVYLIFLQGNCDGWCCLCCRYCVARVFVGVHVYRILLLILLRFSCVCVCARAWEREREWLMIRRSKRQKLTRHDISKFSPPHTVIPSS